MLFITRFWRNAQFDLRVSRCIAIALLCLTGWAHAQVSTEITNFRSERADEDIIVSAQVVFELPSAIEDALLKGVPMIFVAEADLMRERWYWFEKKVRGVERHMRLAYQPLTRRWRLNVSAGANVGNNQGLTLNQNFESLPQAMAAIKRVSKWKLADVSSLDSGGKYRVEFRFRLDLGQLPSPFQIGALGQSEWDIKAAAMSQLAIESAK
jgi:hypothetical protein